MSLDSCVGIMKKAVLFLAIFGLGAGECSCDVRYSPSDVWRSDRSDGLCEKRDLSLEVTGQKKQELVREYNFSLNLAEKRNARFICRLAESLGRVTLGTAAIAGTTLVGVGFIEALRRARSQFNTWNVVNKAIKRAEIKWLNALLFLKKKVEPDVVQIFLNKIGFEDWIRLKKLSSCMSDNIFSGYYYFPGLFGLLKTGKEVVVKGYKFGGEQIYKGVWSVWTSGDSTRASKRGML